jgi:hypothetical protein
VPPPAAAPQPDLIGNQANGPSQTFAVNLLKLMVKKGHITKEEADELIREAEQDTAIARTQAQSDALTAAQAVVEQAKMDKVLPADPSPEDALRIPFIPDMVKKQIRDDLRQEVMAAAKSEHWNAPYQLPDWVSKFRVKGDIRLRYEGTYFSEGNDNTGAFPNFQAINTGAPFDVSGTVFSPQLNVDQDRQRYRIRLRLGAEVDMGDGFTAGVRIGTGQDSSPVSPNQSLGASGGNFSKYAIWLDRAFLKYEAGADPDRRIAITGGRGDNPFYSTDLIYDEDLGFDGLAIQGRYRIAKGVTPFATLGVFPIFNTDFNFSSNQPAKFDSTDKYLYGAQLGTDWKLTKHLTLKTAAAYYQFDGAEGEQSTPYTPLTSSDAGNTDNTRPSFAQKGNTYIPLRRIIPMRATISARPTSFNTSASRRNSSRSRSLRVWTTTASSQSRFRSPANTSKTWVLIGIASTHSASIIARRLARKALLAATQAAILHGCSVFAQALLRFKNAATGRRAFTTNILNPTL